MTFWITVILQKPIIPPTFLKHKLEIRKWHMKAIMLSATIISQGALIRVDLIQHREHNKWFRKDKRHKAIPSLISEQSTFKWQHLSALLLWIGMNYPPWDMGIRAKEAQSKAMSSSSLIKKKSKTTNKQETRTQRPRITEIFQQLICITCLSKQP